MPVVGGAKLKESLRGEADVFFALLLVAKGRCNKLEGGGANVVFTMEPSTAEDDDAAAAAAKASSSFQSDGIDARRF